MITTLTLNAAIDRTYFMSGRAPQPVERVQKVHMQAGGKGVNVSKVLKRLACPVIATGFCGGYLGQAFLQLLNEQDIQGQFVQVAQETRLCLNMIYAHDTHEILEPGPVITPKEWEDLQGKVVQLASISKWMVFSGSLPQGLDETAYAQLILMLKKEGVNVIVDTSGAVLAASIDAQPYMIKCNQMEYAYLYSRETMTVDQILESLPNQSQGIEWFVVTMGSKGAIIKNGKNIYKATPPAIQVKNTVGSGDAFTAGLVAGLYAGHHPEQAIILATASACANAEEDVAGCIRVKRVHALKSKVHIEVMS